MPIVRGEVCGEGGGQFVRDALAEPGDNVAREGASVRAAGNPASTCPTSRLSQAPGPCPRRRPDALSENRPLLPDRKIQHLALKEAVTRAFEMGAHRLAGIVGPALDHGQVDLLVLAIDALELKVRPHQ